MLHTQSNRCPFTFTVKINLRIISKPQAHLSMVKTSVKFQKNQNKRYIYTPNNRLEWGGRRGGQTYGHTSGVQVGYVQPSKCQVVHVTGTKGPVKKTSYVLHGQILESVTSARYLGVDISSNLTWNTHVDRITGNANRTLGFIRRNIKTKMSKVRETAYHSLVRPQLEYASAVWDPNHKKHISQLEQVQRRAARWTVGNFDRHASVTKIMQDLGWRTLDQRRADACLCLFFKVIHGLVAVPLPDYVQYSNRISRHSMTA